MPNKSKLIIGRDIGRTFKEVDEAINDLDLGNDGYSKSEWSVPVYGKEAQRKISYYLEGNNIEWYCDNCNTRLDHQPGFTTKSGSWTCTECGYENSVLESDIQWED